MNNKNDLNAEPNKRLDPKKYPIGAKENRPGRDRISMLEDTDGDGVMDKKTVFADGLELVTSLVFYKDGVIVAQAPDFLWIRDTDGDGKADKVEKILTGWGVGDTHAVTSNLRWGPDGWIYGSVGYSAGTVSSGDGSKNLVVFRRASTVSVPTAPRWNRWPPAAAASGAARSRRTAKSSSPRRPAVRRSVMS